MSNMNITKESIIEMMSHNVKTLFRKNIKSATPEELYQAAAYTEKALCALKEIDADTSALKSLTESLLKRES